MNLRQAERRQNLGGFANLLISSGSAKSSRKKRPHTRRSLTHSLYFYTRLTEMNVPVLHTFKFQDSAGRCFWTLNSEYIINYFQYDCLKKGRRAMVLPVGSLTSSRIFSTSSGWRTQPTAVADTHVACTVKTDAHQV